MTLTPDWLSGHTVDVPTGRETTIALRVAGDDHPGAILTALQAQAAVAAYQHIHELAQLDSDKLYHLLISVRKLGDVTRELEERLLVLLRDSGASWAVLGAALETTRAAARERYQRITAAAEHRDPGQDAQ